MGLWNWLFGSIPAANDWGTKAAPNKRCIRQGDHAEETDDERYERMDEDIEKLRDTREKLKRYRLSRSDSPPPPISVEPPA